MHDPNGATRQSALAFTGAAAGALGHDLYAAFVHTTIAAGCCAGIIWFWSLLHGAHSGVLDVLGSLSAIGMMFLLFWAVYSCVRLIALLLDCVAGHTVRFTGPISAHEQITQSEEGTSTTHHLCFNGRKKALDEAQYAVLAGIGWGTIEYAPVSRTILEVCDGSGHIIYRHGHYTPAAHPPHTTREATVYAPVLTAGMADHTPRPRAHPPAS